MDVLIREGARVFLSEIMDATDPQVGQTGVALYEPELLVVERIEATGSTMTVTLRFPGDTLYRRLVVPL